MGTTPAGATLDIGRCLNDAVEIYRKNFLTLLIAAILFELLSLCSLLILAGPLWGGIILMTLRAMTEPESKARLGDLFSAFHRFGPLVGVFFITFIMTMLGFVLLVIPGFLLLALWLFPSYLVVDRNLGVIEALQMSWRIVLRRGLWMNLALGFILFVILAGPALIPYVGVIVGWFLAPLAWLMNTSAYIQEVREQPDTDAFMPSAFPVVMANVEDREKT